MNESISKDQESRNNIFLTEKFKRMLSTDDQNHLILKKLRIVHIRFRSDCEDHGFDIGFTHPLSNQQFYLYFKNFSYMNYTIIPFNMFHIPQNKQLKKIDIHIEPTANNKLRVDFVDCLDGLSVFISFTCESVMDETTDEFRRFFDKNYRHTSATHHF